MFRLSVADLDSPSYFVAVAAADFGLLQAGRPRCRADAGVRREDRAGAAARRCVAFLRRPGLCGDPRISGLEGRQAPVRAVAIFLLVLGRSCRPRCQARRSRRAQRPAHFLVHGIAGTRPAAPVGRIGAERGAGRYRRSCRRRRPRPAASWAMPVSRPSGKILPTAIGATACGSRLARRPASPKSISICAAATARRAHAGIILPR